MVPTWAGKVIGVNGQGAKGSPAARQAQIMALEKRLAALEARLSAGSPK